MYDLSKGAYDLDAYATDAELLAKINTGRSDVAFGIVSLGNFVAATTPETITQNDVSGVNNIESAKVVTYTFFIENKRIAEIDSDWDIEDNEIFQAWETQLIEAVVKLNSENSEVQFEMFTFAGL